MLVSKHCTANLICTLGTPPPPCIGSGVARVQISGTELCTNNLIPTLATLKDDPTSDDVYQYYEQSLIGWFLALAALQIPLLIVMSGCHFVIVSHRMRGHFIGKNTK